MSSIGEQLVERLKDARIRPGLNAYHPHPKQVDFHADTSKKKLFIGGNRSGKTVGGSLETIWWAKGEHPYRKVPMAPTQLRVVTTDFIEGLEGIVLPEIRRWIPDSLLVNGSWEDTYKKRLRKLELTNKSTIEFMTYEQNLVAFAGTSRTAIWFDEEPPKDIYQECLARLIDQDGSYWITMTPVEGMTWVFDDLYTKAQHDDSIYVLEVDMLDNPHISESAAKSYLDGLDDNERAIRKEGRFVSRSGMIYAPHLRDIHIIDDYKEQAGLVTYEMMDHGFNNPTAWLWAQINPDGDVFIFDEYYERFRTVSQHIPFIAEKRKAHVVPSSYCVGDPSIRNTDPITGTSIQTEYAKGGIGIALGVNDFSVGVDRVIHYLQGSLGDYSRPKLYISVRCTNLLWEIRKLQWASWHQKKLAATRNRKEEQMGKDDHLCDALRYGLMSRPEIDDGTSIPPLDMLDEFIPEVPANEGIGSSRLAGPRWDESKSSRGKGPTDPFLGDEW